MLPAEVVNYYVVLYFKAEMKEYTEKHPDYVPKDVKSFLSKAEQKIKGRSEGKPDKPPV